jgi:hypothetical protein
MCSVISLVAAMLGAQLQDPAVLERACLESRKALGRGEIQIDAHGWSSIGSERRDFRYRTTTVFDGKLIASEAVTFDPSTNDSAPRIMSRVIKCFGEQEHIWYTDQPDVLGNKMLANVTELGHVEDSPHTRVGDPRLLGTLPIAFYNFANHPGTSALGGPDYDSYTVAQDRLGDVECWKTIKHLRSGMTLRAWYSIKKGNSLIRLEAEVHSGNTTYLDIVESEVGFNPNVNVWLPTQSRHTQTINGVPKSEELAVVKIIQLGKPIKPAAFTLAGLGIPAGIGIQTVPSHGGGSQRWDGERIVTVPGVVPTPGPHHVDQSNSAWIIVSVFCSLIAAISFWFMLKFRTRHPA